MRASPPVARSGFAWRRAYILCAAVVALALVLAAGAATWGLAPEAAPLVSSVLLRNPVACMTLAVGLWVLGLIAAQLARPDLAWVVLLLSALCSAGRWAAVGSPIGATAYLLLLLWVGPSLYRFHQHILATPQGCAGDLIAVLLIAAGAWLSVPLVLWRFPVLAVQEWFPIWRTAATIPFGVALGLSESTLISVRIEGWAEARQKNVRLISLGSVVALAPLLLLTLLPEAWGAALYLPLPLTVPFLLLLPMFYLHALTPATERSEGRLLNLSAGLLVADTLAAGVLILAALLNSVALPPRMSWPLLALALGMGVWLARRPLRNVYVRLAEDAWLGHGSSYTQVVARLAESLSATLEPEALQRALVHKLSRTMHASWISLYLRNDAATYELSGSHGLAPTARLAQRTLPGSGPLVTFLIDWARPATRDHLLQATNGTALAAEEEELLSVREVMLWVPLMAGGVLYGILLIGPRPGGESYSREDIQILTTLGHQSGVALQNTRLVMEVQAGREELAHAHQQLLEAGEQERLALAQELHDGAVQQLIAVSYQLAAGRRAAAAATGDERTERLAVQSVLEASRQQVLEVVSQIRGLIGELRPPGLEDLGLVAALQSYVERVEGETNGSGPAISLSLDVDDRLIPQSVALCLFRVAQEGLRNVVRHANASHAELRLTLYGGYVELRLADDGRGFVVPVRLSEMAAQNHFGVVSMAERVARVGGIFTVTSEPGAGTEIRVQVALGEEASIHDHTNPRTAG